MVRFKGRKVGAKLSVMYRFDERADIPAEFERIAAGDPATGGRDQMFNEASAAIVVSLAILPPATSAEAQDVPGCSTGSLCERKCHGNGVIPYVFPTIAACKAYRDSGTSL
jgi:hypothetical protein